MKGASSRAPLAKLQAYKRRMDRAFLWAFSFGNDFNVRFTEEQQREAVSQGHEGARRVATREPSSCSHAGNRRGHVHTRAAGHKRVCTRGRPRLP
ncbi:MAG: DUF899 family protein [Nitrococcus mobilis]|nr:DUF899 family protein [Nitrococcus mobilis]